MKLNPKISFPVLAGSLVLTEEVLRHLTAGSSIVASILSSGAGGLSWEILVAVMFVLCRFLSLWLLPPLLIVWAVSLIWKRPGRT